MFASTSKASRDRAANMAEMADRLGLSTVPAAWPTGASQLARAIAACERCDTEQVCSDWLARVPKSIVLPPAFCPNAEEFKRVKKANERS